MIWVFCCWLLSLYLFFCSWPAQHKFVDDDDRTGKTCRRGWCRLWRTSLWLSWLLDGVKGPVSLIRYASSKCPRKVHVQRSWQSCLRNSARHWASLLRRPMNRCCLSDTTGHRTCWYHTLWCLLFSWANVLSLAIMPCSKLYRGMARSVNLQCVITFSYWPSLLSH